MPNYKNQNFITDISVDKIKHYEGEKEAWMQPFSWDKMLIPMYLLSGSEFKVYIYLFKWAGKTEYDYSPADIKKTLDIGEDTARKILKKFVEYGYLIKITEHRYKFDAYPEKALQACKQKFYDKFHENLV